MSSITAWLSGTSAAPNTPCNRRNADHLLDRLRDAAQHRGDGEAGGADDEQLLAAEPRRAPAERRGHDRGGDDIGGQHPVDLVLRRRQRALHVGQGDVGDRRVERLHDGRHHHADGQQRPLRAGSISVERSSRRGRSPWPGRPTSATQPTDPLTSPDSERCAAGVDRDDRAHAGAQAVDVLIRVEAEAQAECAARP